MSEKVRGWKVFDSELKCRGFQFEIGKSYQQTGQIAMGQNGFHFHTRPAHLFNYYEFSTNNRVCKIAAHGTVLHDVDKGVASDIDIGKELTWHEVLELVNSGNRNSGNRNSGHRNSGNRNSGNWNSGSRNSGSRNSGYSNSGDWNSGDWNSGNRNSGYRNSGNSNSGSRNSGNRNSGNWNSGNWNSGNRNSGDLNTTDSPYRIFNKESTAPRHQIEFPQFFYFNVAVWILPDEMTEAEKQEQPHYETTGGYLKRMAYKEAWRASWDNASDEDRRKVLSLPNFDNEIFLKISGIDVAKELSDGS